MITVSTILVIVALILLALASLKVPEPAAISWFPSGVFFWCLSTVLVVWLK